MVTAGRSGALAACLGVLALCTAAESPSGGMQAPEPGVPAAPATDGGGVQAPEPAPAPPPRPLAAQTPPTTPTEPPVEQPPLQQEQEEEEQEFQIDVPPERKKPDRTPMVPPLRPTGALQPASSNPAGRLAHTGVDPRLMSALGTFMIGVGLTLLGLSLPRRV